MIVCVCNRVSDRDIERAVRDGIRIFAQLQDDTRVATCCGRCGDCARAVFEAACNRHPRAVAAPVGGPVVRLPQRLPA